MRVDFYDYKVKRVGSVVLTNTGEIEYIGQAEMILRDLIILEPGDPSRRLTPDDGVTWLRAVPHEFRTVYLSAKFVE